MRILLYYNEFWSREDLELYTQKNSLRDRADLIVHASEKSVLAFNTDHVLVEASVMFYSGMEVHFLSCTELAEHYINVFMKHGVDIIIDFPNPDKGSVALYILPYIDALLKSSSDRKPPTQTIAELLLMVAGEACKRAGIITYMETMSFDVNIGGEIVTFEIKQDLV